MELTVLFLTIFRAVRNDVRLEVSQAGEARRLLFRNEICVLSDLDNSRIGCATA